MQGKIYLDMVFMTNLIMDYILLRLAGHILECKASRKRSLLGAGAGALAACLFLYLPTDSFLPVTILLHGMTAVIMVKIGCNVKTGSLLIKAIVALYLTAFLCGGFWSVMSTNEKMTAGKFLILSGISYLLFTCVSVGYEYLQIRTKNLYQITLSTNGKVKKFWGLYDTGNLLTDCVTGQPVSVIEEQALKTLLSEEILDKLRNLEEKPGELESTELKELHPHYIPYKSIGEPAGLLLAVTLEDLCIHTPREVIHISKPVLAMSWGSSALGNKYQVLLNSKLLQ